MQMIGIFITLKIISILIMVWMIIAVACKSQLVVTGKVCPIFLSSAHNIAV